MSDSTMGSTRQTFMYFAYGSNLWTKRIRLQNKTAVRRGIAQLKGYRLDFFKPESERSIWNGAAANIIEDENESVWGAVWELDLMDMASLDAQEGVHIDIYVPVIKDVHTPDGESLECRFYQMSNAPNNKLKLSSDTLPHERKPSKTYLNVIVNGAIESELPEKYVSFLERIKHNEKDAHPEILDKLFPEENEIE